MDENRLSVLRFVTRFLLVWGGCFLICAIAIQAHIAFTDAWFLSEQEADECRDMLLKQETRIVFLEIEQKKIIADFQKMQTENEVVHPNTMQPMSNAVQNHLWRERLRNWGQ